MPSARSRWPPRAASKSSCKGPGWTRAPSSPGVGPAGDDDSRAPEPAQRPHPEGSRPRPGSRSAPAPAPRPAARPAPARRTGVPCARGRPALSLDLVEALLQDLDPRPHLVELPVDSARGRRWRDRGHDRHHPGDHDTPGTELSLQLASTRHEASSPRPTQGAELPKGRLRPRVSRRSAPRVGFAHSGRTRDQVFSAQRATHASVRAG